MPLGNSVLFEFSMMRAVSQQLAASTTIRAFHRDFLARFRIDVGDAASPCRSEPTVTSRHIAPCGLPDSPVASAGLICTPGEAKFALTAQARPHSAQ